MKITKLVKKDLKLLKRDSKTLVLTILAPIIILLILGNVFGQTTGSKSISGLVLGVCDLNKEKTDINITLFVIKNLGNNCEEKARELVEMGELRASIVIPEDFSKKIEQGYGSEIILYIDNSKTQTALVASDAIKALVQDLNEKIGIEFIENAWIRLRELNTRLKFVVSNLQVAKEQALQIQEEINSLNENISSIDTTELELQLNQLNDSLSNRSYINVSITPEISGEISRLTAFRDENCPGVLPEEQCLTINITINQLTDINSGLAERETRVNEILNTINTTQIANHIQNIRETRENAREELTKINETIFNYTNNIVEIIDDLNETSRLLDIYTSRDPKNIVRAVALNEKQVFGEKIYFAFLAPGIILILLLFTIILVSSSNIVYERKTGTLARTLLSPTPIPVFIISKIIFFVIISIIELAVMFITVKLFGISLPINASILIVLLIAAINFILIGLLLGSLSNSENTALLSSLVIALPMFFLSNLFFPFEIMPKFMKAIGSNLPLTLSIESLDKLVIYTSPLEPTTIIKLILIPIILGLIVYFFIKRKPTAE